MGLVGGLGGEPAGHTGRHVEAEGPAAHQGGGGGRRQVLWLCGPARLGERGATWLSTQGLGGLRHEAQQEEGGQRGQVDAADRRNQAPAAQERASRVREGDGMKNMKIRKSGSGGHTG